MYYIYMVRCADGSHYTGLARYLCKRMKEHTERTAACAKYTKAHPVVALDALWKTETRADAAKLEAFIKRLSKTQKLALVADMQRLSQFCEGTLDASVYMPLPSITLEDCLNGTWKEA